MGIAGGAAMRYIYGISFSHPRKWAIDCALEPDNLSKVNCAYYPVNLVLTKWMH